MADKSSTSFGEALALWFGEVYRKAGEPSFSLISEKTGLSRVTINRVREGAPDTTEATIKALAAYLGAKIPTVQRSLVLDSRPPTAPVELISAAQDYLQLAKAALTAESEIAAARAEEAAKGLGKQKRGKQKPA